VVGNQPVVANKGSKKDTEYTDPQLRKRLKDEIQAGDAVRDVD
jgi:hypothetical protein